MLRLDEKPVLLDLACGTGWAVRYAAILAKGQGMFYGIDNSSNMIEIAKAGSANYLNVNFRKSKVETLPFEDNFFDFVISSNAFHHFSDPEKALREVHRVLKLRGKVYILDTTADNFFMRTIDAMSHKFEPAHIKLYSTKEFRTLFEKANICYVENKAVFSAIKVHIGEKAS